ncbi:unnamed protein product, partial [Gadus morhua 'NCC']
MADFETEDFSDGSDFEEFLGFEDVDEAEYFDDEYEPIDRELWLRHMFVNDDEEEEVWNGVACVAGPLCSSSDDWRGSGHHVPRHAAASLEVDDMQRYGRSLGLLKDEGTEELALLLKHSHLFLAAQRATTHPTAVPDLHPGQDWLAATLFLMMAGDGERARRWLVDFSSLLCSAFLWPARMHSS